MRCAKQHQSKTCIETKDVQCIKCKGKHMSNDKTCPKYLSYIQIAETNKTNLNIIHTQSKTDTPITNDKRSSYQTEFPRLPPRSWEHSSQEPKAAATTSASPPTTATSGIAEILSFFRSLNLSGTISTIKNVISKIKAAPDTITKITIVLEALVAFLE